jgi:hypothetical protein
VHTYTIVFSSVSWLRRGFGEDLKMGSRGEYGGRYGEGCGEGIEEKE